MLLFIVFIIILKAIGRGDVADSYFGFSKFLFVIPALMNVGMGSFQEIQSLKTIKKLLSRNVYQRYPGPEHAG